MLIVVFVHSWSLHPARSATPSAPFLRVSGPSLHHSPPERAHIERTGPQISYAAALDSGTEARGRAGRVSVYIMGLDPNRYHL